MKIRALGLCLVVHCSLVACAGQDPESDTGGVVDSEAVQGASVNSPEPEATENGSTNSGSSASSDQQSASTSPTRDSLDNEGTPPGDVSRSSYPEGPYGYEEGSVSDNMTFLTADDEQVSLQDVRSDGDGRYLIIFGTAAWCSKCSRKMPSIKAIHAAYGPKGLKMMTALYEDRTYNKPVARELMAYGRQYDLEMPVVGDGEKQIADFFGGPNMPMVLLFNLDTMVVEYLGRTWEEETIEALLEDRLGETTSTD